MVTTAFPQAVAARAQKLPEPGPLLLATDGSEASDAAFAVAKQLVGERGADARVLAVVEPLPVIARDVELPDWVKELNATRHEELGTRARQQLAAIGSPEWEIEIREGAPAVEIARAARERRAALVVIGIGRHTLRDRLFGDETALQLLRISDVPVFAVTPGATGLPRRVILATDFSEASVRALRGALSLLAEDATVYLTHVVPRFAHLSGIWAAMQQSYVDSLAAEFERVRARLEAPATMTVESITLKGVPARELIDFAEASQADLIVCGSHGQGMISRLLLGSVATYVVRGSPCPVLIFPERRSSGTRAGKAVEQPAVHREAQTMEIPRDKWPEVLKAFTAHNSARHCRIEVADPSIGARAQVVDYPLLGVAFDRHDQRVEVMVGEHDGAHHVTRGITGVTGLSLLVDEHGRDRMLQITHGDGQTMIWLESNR
jgi:nucleotide-binding universal stress UspA family protein